MGVWETARREARFLRGLVGTLRRVRGVGPASVTLACDDIEAAVDRFGPNLAFSLDGRTLTYAQFDALANRFAHWALGRRLKRGEVVALFAPNRLDYVAVWYGLSKVGVATALINNNLAGQALAHCFEVCQAHHVIVDAETAATFDAARPLLSRPVTEWVIGGGVEERALDRDLDKALKSVSSLRPARESVRGGMTGKDTCLFIFTSGTTGLPKAARITHARAQLYMRGFAGATGATAKDKVFNVLPLYHATGGLCAVGAAILNGGAVVLRTRFSASRFWADVRAEGATMFVYIGELCRYLVNAPETGDEHGHRLKLAFGNGLRPDVWERMQTRFRIPRVLEFYGSTEGNVSLFNFDGRTGAVGRVPKYLRKAFNVRLVRYDVEMEAPERDGRGFCVACRPGEVGEALGQIGADARSSYTGYADNSESEKKVLRDVFAKGDAWFRTGDLMRQDEDGYFYFVDRIGDTFRWKGENVSTSDVAEHLAEVNGVEEATVYGVPAPGAEGRAGMASLSVDHSFALDEFQKRTEELLPSYAQPLFLRLKTAIETTGTFKYRKADLVADGFDPGRVAEPLYFKVPGEGYQAITPELHQRIVDGAFRL